METTAKLVAEIEAVAKALGIAPSTVGERAGQGGHFYKRLAAGKQALPSTIANVRERLKAMQVVNSDLADAGKCDNSHVHPSRARQATTGKPAYSDRGA